LMLAIYLFSNAKVAKTLKINKWKSILHNWIIAPLLNQSHANKSTP
jgi:hypothetical protein